MGLALAKGIKTHCVASNQFVTAPLMNVVWEDAPTYWPDKAHLLMKYSRSHICWKYSYPVRNPAELGFFQSRSWTVLSYEHGSNCGCLPFLTLPITLTGFKPMTHWPWSVSSIHWALKQLNYLIMTALRNVIFLSFPGELAHYFRYSIFFDTSSSENGPNHCWWI